MKHRFTIVIVLLCGLLPGAIPSSLGEEDTGATFPAYGDRLDAILEMRKSAITPEQVSMLLEMAVETTQRSWKEEGRTCLEKLIELDGTGPGQIGADTIDSLASALVNFEKPLPGVDPLVQFFAYQKLLEDADLSLIHI